eukprot:188898-Pyramimonas_sp.AAC.1
MSSCHQGSRGTACQPHRKPPAAGDRNVFNDLARTEDAGTICAPSARRRLWVPDARGAAGFPCQHLPSELRRA